MSIPHRESIYFEIFYPTLRICKRLTIFKQRFISGLSKDGTMGEDLVFFCASDVGSTIKAKWNQGKFLPTDDVTIDGINIVKDKKVPTKQVDGVITIYRVSLEFDTFFDIQFKNTFNLVFPYFKVPSERFLFKNFKTGLTFWHM